MPAAHRQIPTLQLSHTNYEDSSRFSTISPPPASTPGTIDRSRLRSRELWVKLRRKVVKGSILDQLLRTLRAIHNNSLMYVQASFPQCFL